MGKVPLHVAIVLLAPVEIKNNGSHNPSDVLNTASPLKDQVEALTGQPTQSLVRNVLITVIAEVKQTEGESDPAVRTFAHALLYYDNDGPAKLISSNVGILKGDSWSSIITSIHHSTTKGKFKSVPTSHFVIPLPEGAYFTSANLRGLCYLDTVINDESEATSTYPFAEHFVPEGRKLELNGRMTVGFIKAVGDQVTVISSCRPPVELSQEQRTIEGHHYSKGGDMVMRGFLWNLDVGSAIDRAGATSSTIPKRSVIVPFMAGVHSDVMLSAVDCRGVTPQPNNGQRLAVFPLRRPIVDSHCSSDPSNPVRVSSHMTLYVNTNTEKLRNGFDVFVRVINGTALMTGFSDLTISTNCPADQLMKYLRAEVRGIDPLTFINNPELFNTSQGHYLDTSYGNPLGELVIMTAHKQSNGRWMSLAGNTHFPLISQLGFHDLVRYSEDDVYLSRDQFDYYCGTLHFFEARDEFLNQIRFEAPWDEIDEGPLQPVINKRNYLYRRIYINVLQSHMAKHVTFGDKRMKDGWSWRDKQAFGINVTVRPGQKQRTDDRRRNTISYPVPATTLAYDVTIVPPKTCRFQGNASTHLRSATEANVAGCYTVAYTHHGGWGRNDVYNAMWIMPTHRAQLHFLGGYKSDGALNSEVKDAKWRGLEGILDIKDRKFPFNRNSTSAMYRETIVYLRTTPLNTYGNGGIFMLYMEEGEDLDAFKNREEGGSEEGKQQGYYGLHRFAALNHGRNNQPNHKGAIADGHPRFRIPGLNTYA
eukprot:GILI01004799.1.p1 GENE.GILI01004799.1~~GILI01004799.1.p1  ORF type:complete len:891 (+),score=105.13 GILI01004799.1:396-2675(+)